MTHAARKASTPSTQRVKTSTPVVVGSGSSPEASDSAASNSGNSSPSNGGRLQRNSAKLASLKNQMLYMPGGRLQNSPMLSDSMRSDSDIMKSLSMPIILPDGLFVEPELAQPQPLYSGLPLEAPPNQKIKKESLWPSRIRKKLASSRNGTVVVAPTEVSPQVEQRYRLKLAHQETPRDSQLRRAVVPKAGPKLSAKNRKVTLTIPASPASRPGGSASGTTRPAAGAASPLRASKRIKISSPKKPVASANLAPTTPSDKTFGTSGKDISDNDDFCGACGGSGVFICCESCPKSFHFLCCDPPLDGLPEDNWICRECQAKKADPKQFNKIGIFGQLLKQLLAINPVEFQLPKRLRDSTFLNVHTDEYGGYDDDSLKPEFSYSKAHASQLAGYNYNYDLDVDNLYDKEGQPYLCHKCGLLGLHRRLLVHCDYCPLVWHIDCLKDPIYSPKTIGSKWRCPNHYENLLPLNLYSKRMFKDTPVLDVSLHSHFLKIAQHQNLLIKYSDQPWLKQNGKPATLQEYLQYETDNFNKFNPDYNPEKMIADNTNTLDNSDDIDENFKVPDFFDNNFPTEGAIVSQPNKRLKKIITMTDPDADPNTPASFVYRIPEELIVLDFFTKVRSDQKKRPRRRRSVKDKVLNDISRYEKKKDAEIGEQKEFVLNAQLLKLQAPCTISDLIKAAVGEPKQTKISELEIQDLLSIKQLLETKGRDAVEKFLQSDV